ncbi:anti-sigma factor domain-containing protein [Hafnia alvei]|uniref:anti-sigma factor n=1 Tax=Hafnia alvei TaxID=569 RepID=UPI0010342AB8|nr:anti-sigma factor [Hafnia alvei]TBL83406.1 hypothetical protein EYY88_15970 [Hafnia alvei]
MIPRTEHLEQLAGEYVLGTLRGLPRARFERWLEQMPDLQVHVLRWQNGLAPLDDLYQPIQPPTHVWQNIVRQLDSERDNVTSIKSHWIKRHGWIGVAALAAACLLLVLLPRTLVKPFAPPSEVAVLATQDNNMRWQVSLNPDSHALTLTPPRGLNIPSDRSLELWAIPKGGKPISLGIISNTALSAVSALGKPIINGSLLAISLEPRGGSPTGQPTGKVLFTGSIQL